MELLDIVLPTGAGANLQLPDPYMLNYYEALDNRTLWLDTEVTGETIEIAKKIQKWNSDDEDSDIPIEKRKPIKICISSGGGDAYVMWAVVDTILASKTPVYTINMGLAGSAACVILVSGHKRFSMPHAHALWHSGSGGISGTMDQIQSASKHFDAMEAHLQAVLLERTKIDVKQYKKQKDKDWYFTAEQMLESGLVDSIVSDISTIL